MRGLRGRLTVRALGRNDKHTNQNEREVGHGCLTNTREKTYRESGPICLTFDEARRGCIYMQMVRMGQEQSVS